MSPTPPAHSTSARSGPLGQLRSTSLRWVYQSILSIHLPIYLYIYLSIYLSISNPARPLNLCKEWAIRIAEEYFAQVGLSIYLSIHLPNYLYIYLSIYISPAPPKRRSLVYQQWLDYIVPQCTVIDCRREGARFINSGLRQIIL